MPVPLSAHRAAPRSPPDHLEPPEAALWDSIVGQFVIDDDASQSLLLAALEAHARARRCRATIDTQGEVVVDRWNQTKPHPLLAAERGARDSFCKCMRALNLSLGGLR
jgi:hypothetical protein